MAPSSDFETFRATLQSSKQIIVVSGAGLSAASGIPTFRGAGGFWRTFDVMTLAVPEAFEENPSRVWQFYHMRREKARQALPNAAHMALATLVAIPERLAAIAPEATITHITQNVDGLNIRALQMIGADPSEALIYQMHGNVFDVICTVCDHKTANHDSPICASLEGTDLAESERQIPIEELPRCTECGGLLRPGVVWFGETPHDMDEIQEVVDEADLALIVGTSSTVYPAAGYANDVEHNGGKVAVFNLDRSRDDEYADFLFLGPCEKTLPHAFFGAEL
ncbi:hypothetical protein BOTBODRAFT_29100 [Botryobasidium botryosum FD-172 SS1]|uniref:Deacetylase sirtuin-type domain-containing protein n=1 Tax=Botryobasidium botryosum (strain FD-172 SS1) TaxID=930990 RepID=A0A067N4N1_BOTB1|nr:hypothetical protein BOTBODRAFT_29100 [Botryobasidium botryosum FD-172 SS1]